MASCMLLEVTLKLSSCAESGESNGSVGERRRGARQDVGTSGSSNSSSEVGWDAKLDSDRELFQDINHKRECFGGIRDELLPVAWHPDRFFDWCIDEDPEGRRLGGNVENLSRSRHWQTRRIDARLTVGYEVEPEMIVIRKLSSEKRERVTRVTIREEFRGSTKSGRC